MGIFIPCKLINLPFIIFKLRVVISSIQHLLTGITAGMSGWESQVKRGKIEFYDAHGKREKRTGFPKSISMPLFGPATLFLLPIHG
jgi:hypothetical protein